MLGGQLFSGFGVIYPLIGGLQDRIPLFFQWTLYYLYEWAWIGLSALTVPGFDSEAERLGNVPRHQPTGPLLIKGTSQELRTARNMPGETIIHHPHDDVSITCSIWSSCRASNLLWFLTH